MAGEGSQTKPISLFYSYSHKDEDLRLKLQDHLAWLKWSGMIAEWHDRDIEAGKEWEKEIDDQLSSADIILLLVSASFIASKYCWSVEIKKALERHERGEARVIPVILRPCRWQRTPFARLQATPKDAKPVTQWLDWDAAFDDVVSKIEAVVDQLQQSIGNEADAAVGAMPAPEGPGAGTLLTPPPAFTDFAVFRDIEALWCPEMMAFPAGKFLMGSPESEKGRVDDEGPQHRVTISSRFAMGRYLVTFDEYDHFCDVRKREKPEDEGWGRGQRPVINVSWHDAQAYCEWLSEVTDKPYRLPSEAQWEYACRAGTTTPFSCGETITGKDANFGANVGKTTEVGSFAPNPWGLYDMHGNVWEWCADRKGAYTPGAVANPTGASAGAYRVFRGGSWYDGSARGVRSASRFAFVPGLRYYDLGFRCARVQS